MDSEYSQILPFLEINENYDRLIHLLGLRVTWIILKGSADTMEPIIVLIWLNILATTVLLIIFTHAHTRTHTRIHTHTHTHTRTHARTHVHTHTHISTHTDLVDLFPILQ